MRALLSVLLISGILAGCSTNPISAEQAKPVPADRILLGEAVSPGDGFIVITRDGGAFGSGCYLGAYLDGVLAARLGSGETVRLPVSPGEYLIGLAGDPQGAGLCAIGGMPLREVQTTVKSAGETRRFRISGDLNVGFLIAPTSL